MNGNTRDRRDVPAFGDIYLMRFDGTGSEQNGVRPGVVFQNNVGNVYSPNIIALPITSAIKKTGQPTHVVVYAKDSDLLKDSMVLCENPEKMSKTKLIKKIGHLSDAYMRKVCIANAIATGVLSFLSMEDVMAVWEKSVQMNCAA